MLVLLSTFGAPAWLALAFGVMLLFGAALYARRPAARTLAFLGAISRALVFILCGGFASGLGWTIHNTLTLTPEQSDFVHPMLLAGVRESLGFFVFGAAPLALGWLIVALGTLRAAASKTSHRSTEG